jgi:16S rRNA (uracil1498-N3)-methyltransferase
MDDGAMKFMLHPDAGSRELVVSGEDYKYLIKVRRHKTGDLIGFRSPEKLTEECRYRLERTDGRNAYFTMESRYDAPCEAKHKLHIGWCLIDPKTIEKNLPMLTELGVSKITFIHCRRSQRNFRLDLERFRRIMESSIMQCGRSSLIELEESPTLNAFLQAHPDAAILDFGGEVLRPDEQIETVVIGCEGGFDESERKLFFSRRVRVFSSPMILRSETAAVAIASRLL